jgi:hypothetical protein
MLRDFCKEEFDIVIQAGQSNSEGYGLGAATSPYVQSTEILYLTNDFTISVAQEAVSGNEIMGNFSLAFCTKYIESGMLQCGRKLLIIRAAIGGTGFLDHRWGMNDDLYLRMIEMIKTALELNTKNKLVAFLWHQGETEAILNANKQEHFNNLSMFVNSVRSIFNCENLPFIAGDFVSQWKNDNMEICVPVVAAIKEVCASISHAQFVETNELQSNDQKIHNQDSIHFCREALNQLGIKYFNSFYDITK